MMQFVRFSTGGEAPRWGRLSGDEVHELSGAPYQGGEATGQVYAKEAVRLHTPVEPSKIVCIGKNYAAHAAELGSEPPKEPMFFLKAPTTLIGPDEAIQLLYPEHTVHWEAELAVVIGRPMKRVSPEEALAYIFGYTIANDVSDRDFQTGDAPFNFSRAKNQDTFCPCGPVLVTEGINPFDTQITLKCNGELRQSDSTNLMTHNLPKLLSHLSQIMTLLPGDLVLTGTPKGVGAMKPGDLIEIEIAGIGTLSNPVA